MIDGILSADTSCGEAVCRNAFPSGLQQPPGSSRFSVDALLLAAFTNHCLGKGRLRLKNPLREAAFDLPCPGRLACADLGCGCGVTALALALLRDDVKIWGVDIEAALVKSADTNARKFGYAAVTRFKTADVRTLAESSRPCCDVVLMNPPYWEEGEGRASPDPMKNKARRGIDGLRHFCTAACRLLVHHGRLFVIFPASRLVRLIMTLEENGFGIRRLRCVRSFYEEAAGRVLVEAWRSAASVTEIDVDVVLYERSLGGGAVPTAEALALCPWLR